MAFILNPYNADLNLADIEDGKLFTEGCKGVSDKEFFNGKKQYYGTFVKLIKCDLNARRTMAALKTSTKWTAGGATGAAKRLFYQREK